MKYSGAAFAKAILGPDASKKSVHVKYPKLHRRMQIADAASQPSTWMSLQVLLILRPQSPTLCLPLFFYPLWRYTLNMLS